MMTLDNVFETGEVNSEIIAQAEPGSDTAKAVSCAIALSAWAYCMAGNKIPEKFGVGMMALAEWSGLNATDLLKENAGKVADRALTAMGA